MSCKMLRRRLRSCVNPHNKNYNKIHHKMRVYEELNCTLCIESCTRRNEWTDERRKEGRRGDVREISAARVFASRLAFVVTSSRTCCETGRWPESPAEGCVALPADSRACRRPVTWNWEAFEGAIGRKFRANNFIKWCWNPLTVATRRDD